MNPVSRWLQQRRLDRELADEMAEHLAEKVDRLREEGYSEDEARALARRNFGNMTLQQEDSRAAWGWNTVEQLWQDLRFGWRVLTRTPAFTATVVIVLALGIGMNTAMFSAVKAVLLSTLPYPEPERMVTLGQTAKDGHLMHVSGLDFRDWRAQNQTLESMATYWVDDGTLSGSFPARRARMASVGGGFFDVLETHAAVGRTFSAGEQEPGGTPTLVFGYELAEAMFGTPANAIQKTVSLNGVAYTVIGVMPPRFNFPDTAQLWLPNDRLSDPSTRSAHNYRVVGRLKPGVTVSQVRADMDVVAAQLAKEYVDDKDEGIRVTPLFESLVSGVRPALLVLLGAVTLVLVIACVNISNLLLARAAARRKEMGMRCALGAARGRLVRQLLTESVLLSGAGGLLGLALAKFAVTVLRTAAPANIPRIENLDIDTGVLCFTAGLSLLVGILFGLLPSLDASRSDVSDALKNETGKGTGIRHKRWAQTLVAGQIALAIVLLSGAAMLLKSYWKLAHVETGLDSGGVYVTGLTWPAADATSIGWWGVDAANVRQAGGQMLEQIERLAGVQAAALIHGLPLIGGGAPDGSFEIEGRPLPADPHMYPDADHVMITADYFRAFRIPILRGRGFTFDDERAAQQVAIVNQSFQKRFFPAGDPLGQRVRFLGFDRKPEFMTIVGIVPDVRSDGLNRRTGPQIFVEYFQHAGSVTNVSLVVRGPARLHPAIERIVTSLNRSTAVNFESMDGLISGTIARERFQTALLSLFAACALLLAVVGVYGLLSYSVTRRTSEMGLRMALGASSGSVARLVLGQGGALVLAGVTLGSVGSLLATRALQSVLTGVTSDPSTLLVVVAGFALAALLGCYLPARRASRIDPSDALRAE
jgi:putative ABC transport system permease protein